MSENRFETHFHTQETSPCGKVPAAEGVRLYQELGYQGLVVTDHYFKGYFEERLPDVSWAEQLDYYLAGYEAARQAGASLGVQVFLGMEIRFLENSNDYLVYGISCELLLAYPRLYEMSLASFRPFAREHGLLLYQAHPFRNGMTVMLPQNLYGMEVYNGHPRHDARNPIALEWAETFALKQLAGSDFHQVPDKGLGGVDFVTEIKSYQDYVTALREGHYELYRGPAKNDYCKSAD